MQVLERYEEAIATFDKVIELNPNSYKAWNYRGYILVNLERDEEALDSFDRALNIHPKAAEVYYNKAICYALQEQVKLAVKNLKQAILLNQKYREEARTEPDFEAIADHKQFKALIEG